MGRQNWIRRLSRWMVLIMPGAALMGTGTSCGDQLRQTLIETSVTFVGEATETLLEEAIGGILPGQSQTGIGTENTTGQ